MRRTQTGCTDSPDKNLGTVNPQVVGSSPTPGAIETAGQRGLLGSALCASREPLCVCCTQVVIGRGCPMRPRMYVQILRATTLRPPNLPPEKRRTIVS